METFVSGAIFALFISLITQFVKKYIQPKFGDLGVQGFVFLLAVLVGVIQYFSRYLPAETLAMIGTVWAFAIAWYDLLIKRITNLIEKHQ